MPKQYEQRRDQLKRKGMSDAAAKKRAAREYNARRGSKKPVTRKSH